jgi:transcriptional regulator with XRE-family HTH domain
MSQSELGKCVDMTFQQIQKYERGTNRVSASVLYEFAKKLSVPVTFFYDGLSLIEEGKDRSSDLERRSYVSSREGLHLIDAFRQLPARLRKPMLNLLDSMVGGDEAPSSESIAG